MRVGGGDDDYDKDYDYDDNALVVGLSRARRAHGVWRGIWERFQEGTRLNG